MAAFGFNTPFSEQIEFLRAKLDLPSERWDDIKKSAHDRAFIVAGAMKADLVSDLHGAMIKAAEQGTGLEAFRRDFSKIVQKHGWTGWTGEGSAAGQAWRTKVIYQTNMATSYAAGRYRQLTDPGFLELRPYWRYVHNDSVMHPRPLHQHWGAIRLTLLHDHPFWRLHFPPQIPPNWGCECRVTPTDAPAEGDATEPPAGWQTVDSKFRPDNLVAAGWNFAPGANVQRSLKEFIDHKLINLDSLIGSAMYQALAPVLRVEQGAAYREWLIALRIEPAAKSQTPIIGAIDPADLAWLSANGKALPDSAEIAVSSSVIDGPKAMRHAAKGDSIPEGVWENLPEMMADPLAVLYDEHKGTMLYILPEASSRRPQLTVEFEFKRKGKVKTNLLISAYRSNLADLLARITGDRSLSVIRGGLE